jgi:hypothetical protein
MCCCHVLIVVMGREKMFLIDYLKGLYEALLEVEADISVRILCPRLTLK